VKSKKNGANIMPDFLNKILDKTASDYAEQGYGTGGVSKILSGLSFLVLSFLCAYLFNDKLYIPLIILAVLSWNRYGYIIIVGILGYFIFAKYWIGIGLILLYWFIGITSIQIGKRNVKKLIFEQKPIINPFDGQGFILIFAVLQCLFCLGAMITHGIIMIILWVLFGIITIFLVQTYILRLFPKWRSIHYPLMIRYARVAAKETVESEAEHRQYDFLKATQLLMQTVYQRDEEKSKQLILKAYERMKNFSDRELLEKYCYKKNPSVNPLKLTEFLDAINKNLNFSDKNKSIIFYGIAEVVEDIYGCNERIKYLWAYFIGEAK
jgi:hypothetical protein